MKQSLSLWLASSAATTHASAVRLYSAHSDGNVTTLSLTGGSGNYTLAVASVTADCEANPAALTLDKENGVLYCYDRGGSTDTAGSLNSFAIDRSQHGALTRISRVEAPYSGVWGEILTVEETGKRVYVSASYTPGAVGVFSLGLDNDTLPGTGPMQTIFPTIETPGPVADRQERSHLHHVIFDPSNTYILIPDLGGDRVRVFTYNGTGHLMEDETSVLTADAGAGPRHGFFRVNDAGETFFLFNGELSRMVYSYKVTYAEDGSRLRFEKVFETTALGADGTLAAETASTSECAMTVCERYGIPPSPPRSNKVFGGRKVVCSRNNHTSPTVVSSSYHTASKPS